MTWFNGLVVYAITWWVVLFTVLPWGVRPPENPGFGHAHGAPDRPLMGRKIVITTLLAAVVWVLIDQAIRAEFFSFREMAARRPG